MRGLPTVLQVSKSVVLRGLRRRKNITLKKRTLVLLGWEWRPSEENTPGKYMTSSIERERMKERERWREREIIS